MCQNIFLVLLEEYRILTHFGSKVYPISQTLSYTSQSTHIKISNIYCPLFQKDSWIFPRYTDLVISHKKILLNIKIWMRTLKIQTVRDQEHCVRDYRSQICSQTPYCIIICWVFLSNMCNYILQVILVG